MVAIVKKTTTVTGERRLGQGETGRRCTHVVSETGPQTFPGRKRSFLADFP